MSKVYSLVFDYELGKVASSGRHWAESVYKGKDHVFSYTAASVATFLHRNLGMPYAVYTDDRELFADKIDRYDVPTSDLDIIDLSEEIGSWRSHWYSFWPLVQVVQKHLTGEGFAMKLDNDLTCLKPIGKLLEHDGAVVWKRERQCSNGREYWGERKACREGLGTDDFPIHNTGVFGLSPRWHAKARDVVGYCESLINVDISDVSRFPEKPGEVAKTWNASEQSAINYFLHKEEVPVLESHEYVEHHCYTHSKQGVLDGAKYLLRR